MRDSNPKINDLTQVLGYGGKYTAERPPGSHKLTVNNGHGAGDYPAGTFVKVSATEPTSDEQFAGWTGDTAILDNPLAPPSATVTMPSIDVIVTATYSGSDDSPRNAPQRHKGR